MADGTPTLDELARTLERFREDVREDFMKLAVRLDNLPYVSKELYNANRQAMKDDLQQVADVARAANERSESAWRWLRWMLGAVVVTVLGMMTTLILALVTNNL